jgi:hypothetical protein
VEAKWIQFRVVCLLAKPKHFNVLLQAPFNHH